MTAELSGTSAGRSDVTADASLLIPLTVACGSFMTALDQNVVVTALPDMGRSLGVLPNHLGLIVTAYLASLIISMPIGGWAAERFGLRNSYCAAMLIFVFASFLCGAVSDFWMLVAARTLQGFGGALIGTLGQVVILQSFPRHRTLKINMYVSLASQSGPLVGPLVGGALATYLSWRWIFFINIPLGLLAVIAASRLFPNSKAERWTRFDAFGFLLVGAGMVLFVLGMNSLASNDLPLWAIVLELLSAVALLGGAAAYLLRARQPLLDLSLLRIRTFRASMLTGGGAETIGISSIVFLLPLYFQLGFGMSALQAGSLTFLAAIGSIGVRFFMPAILRGLGFRTVLVVNTPIIAAFIAGFAMLAATTPIWFTMTYIFLFGIFRSVQWSSSGNLAYSDIEQERLPRFSALYFVLWQMASAVSVGLAAALLSLLAGAQEHASADDFRIVFLIEGAITLAAIFAYLRLQPQDGRHVSGHAPQMVD